MYVPCFFVGYVRRYTYIFKNNVDTRHLGRYTLYNVHAYALYCMIRTVPPKLPTIVLEFRIIIATIISVYI